MVQAVLFAVLLVAASAIDIRERIIPNSICVMLALAGLIGFSPVRLLGILAALPLFIAAAVKPGSIGGGDIKLTAACGLVLGASGAVAGLVFGLAAMLLFFAGHRMVIGHTRKESNPALPMAPFLSLGFAGAYVFGGSFCLNITGA